MRIFYNILFGFWHDTEGCQTLGCAVDGIRRYAALDNQSRDLFSAAAARLEIVHIHYKTAWPASKATNNAQPVFA